jgi:Na+-driven multidrug efflux pump
MDNTTLYESEVTVKNLDHLPLLDKKDNSDIFIPKGELAELNRSVGAANRQKQRQQEEDEAKKDFFDIENKSMFQFIKLCIVEGLPASLCYGDYYICSLICRILLSTNKDINLVASTGYLHAYIGIFMQCFVQGGIEYQGIMGSQAYGAGNFKRVNLYLRQAMVTGIAFFCVFTLLPTYFIEEILFLVGVNGDLIVTSKSLIMWGLPAMGMRVISDNFKTFIVNQGYLKKAGFTLGATMIFFSIVAYFMIVTFDLGAAGMGISVFLYEMFAFVNMYFFVYRNNSDERCKDSSIKLFTDFTKFLWPAVKIMLVEYPIYYLYNCLNVIVGWTKSKEQLAAYSLGYTLMLVMVHLMNGFNIFTRTQLNYSIGINSTRRAWLVFKKMLIVGLVIAVLVVTMTVGVFQFTFHMGYIESDGVMEILKVLQYYIYLYVVITTYNRILKAVLLTFEYFGYLSILQIFVDVIMVVLAYYLCLTKGKGSEGIFQALIFVIVARVGCHFIKLLGFVNWKDRIEGPNGLSNRVNAIEMATMSANSKKSGIEIE